MSGTEFGPPAFVGAGYMKAGTTWWWKLLVEHPEVANIDPRHDGPWYGGKQLHYFDKFHSEPWLDNESIEEYWQLFPREEGQIAGEWTPRYAVSFWVPELLWQAAPDAKILILVRDPIKRYESQQSHNLLYTRDGGLNVDLDQPLWAEDAFTHGLYAQGIDRILRYYPRNQVRVLQYEQCLRDPLAAIQATYSFLGISSDFQPPSLLENPNPGGAGYVLPGRLRDSLWDAYEGENEMLFANFSHLERSLWLGY